MRVHLLVTLVLATTRTALCSHYSSQPNKISLTIHDNLNAPYTCYTDEFAASHPHQSKRSHNKNISITPGSLPVPPNNIKASTSGYNSTSGPGVPTVDTIITTIFRALITILSLLNLNINWRLHGT